MKKLFKGIYKVQFLIFVCLLVISCKKDEPEKKDFVNVEVHVSVGLNNIVAFQLLNGTEQIYSESLIGENKKTAQGHPISSVKQYNIKLPIEKANNLIVKYGIEVKTREQGWGGWFRLNIDRKDYIDEQVTTGSVLKNIDLDKPLYGN